ncbi:phosphotransferase [Paenibacillus sp. QZ-Y1]|uniref:phosphotransferase n=1 Tax=Paenibacillus sp. QZ-Y1 TaxID=3414511 RepID=UPI003F78E9A5
MLVSPHERILSEIIADIKGNLGLITDNAEQNHFGFANLKWKLNTNSGTYFVKQYNASRYSDNLLVSVERALGFQDRLQKAGIPCPKVLPHGRRYIQRTPSGERYMISSFCKGTMVNPGEVNTNQMYHLGYVTGKLHKWLNYNAPKSVPLHWAPISKELMISRWKQNWDEAQRGESSKYISALELQKKIIEEIDLAQFELCEEGWVHWDLFVDNILFYPNQVSGILDFDRMHYIYPEFDISRAILSGCILNNNINIESTRAFIKGYRESIPLSVSKIVRSIKLTWWKEASWIKVKSEEYRTLRRFVEELIWVSENWSNLDEIFNDM